MPAIFAENLKKTFPPDIHAVAGINLDIAEGSVFGFLGANGSGKTTTVRMLTTLLKPTSGRAEVGGLDVLKNPNQVRHKVGVALQEVSLDDIQTGRETLTLQARMYKVPSEQVRERVNHLLDVVDLTDAADRRIKTYSGGMQRRLDLAAALVHQPSIAFLDEPTTGLDPISREAVWRYIQAINKEEGVTIFLTTQYLEEADRLCGEVAIMDSGRIVAQGSPAELKAGVGADRITIRVEGGDEENERAAGAARKLNGVEDATIIGDSVVIYIRDGSAAVAPLVLLLAEANVKVEEITLARPTLDDVFIRTTGHHIETHDSPLATPYLGKS